MFVENMLFCRLARFLSVNGRDSEGEPGVSSCSFRRFDLAVPWPGGPLRFFVAAAVDGK